MLDLIFRLNRWYDDLDVEHGVLRFALCVVPLTLFNVMLLGGGPLLQWLGLIGFAVFTFVRVTPVFVRKP